LSFIKKYGLYGSAVAVALVLAAAMLLAGPVKKAEAVFATAANFNAPIQAAGLTETWSMSGWTSGTTTNLTSVTVTFPGTTFTIPAAPTVTVTGGGAACTVSGATTTVATNTVVVATITGVCNAGVTGLVTVAGVVNPVVAANIAQAGFTLATSNDVAAGATNTNPIGIWNLTATKSPTTSVAADGASTVSVTFVNSVAAAQSNTGSGTARSITLNTDVGTIAQTPVNTGTFTVWDAVVPPTQQAQATLAASLSAAGQFVAVIKAPSSPGTSTVIVRATPASGGQAVIIGSTQITWVAATSQGAPASGSANSPATTITQNGSVLITFTFVDANGNAPIPGGTVTCTTTLGLLTVPSTLGSQAGFPGQAVTGSLPVGGVFTITLTGGGLGGSATVTCTVNNISVSRVITISGTATVMTLRFVRNQGTAAAPAIFDKGSIRNTGTTSTTSYTDEGIVLASLKDANGNAIAAGNVSFTLTGPAGFTLGFVGVTAAGATPAGAQMPPMNSQAVVDATAICQGGGAGAGTCTSHVITGGGGTGVPAAQAFLLENATSASPDPIGKYTVTATYTNTDATVVTANTSFTMVKSTAAIATGTVPAGIPVGGTASATFTCKDTDGNACASGTAIGINVAAANVLAQDPSGVGGTGQALNIWTNDAGVATVTLIGVTAGTTQVVANSGTLTAVMTVTVGGVAATPTGTAPAGGTGTFDRPIPSIGVNTAIWGGGSVSQLAAAVASAGGISVTVFVNGAPVVLIPGAPDFVNAAFNAAFPAGVPAGTIVLVVK